MSTSRRVLSMVAAACGLVLASTRAEAQYFGRNKVQYETFHFQVLKTEHFDVYYYPAEEDGARIVGRMAERWYARLSNILSDSLHGRQPILLYASGAQFQQTNAVEGDLGEGTGGVTESFKRRVVIPFGISLAETDHVLGHELVHAFQYDITARGPGGGPGATNLPLWFIEGMAEYLSLGPEDAFTSMWMRDAVLHNDIPTIKKMDDPKYFPYRYGQAFWAYIGSNYGEDIIGTLLRAASRARDPLIAFRNVLRIDPDSLSAHWHSALRDAFSAANTTAAVGDSGVALLTKQSTGGRLNVGPALSPDGNRVAFISERDLFSVDIFLADANTGRIIRRLTSTARNAHLESIQFIYSSGAFSPDGQRFALATTVRGRPALTVLNAENGSTVQEARLPGLDDILNPSWSPNGHEVVFTGQAGGMSDLYIYDLDARQLRQVTHDAFADLEPAWSPDGNTIAFVSDRFGTDLDNLSYGRYRLALLDVGSGRISQLPQLGAGIQLNPQWGQGARSLFFLADPDGLTNVYRMDMQSNEVTRITDLPLGVSGITVLSPSLAVASGTDRMMISVRNHDINEIRRLDGSQALAGTPVPSIERRPSLAVGNLGAPSQVAQYLADSHTGLPASASFTQGRVPNSLQLDYVAPPSIAAGTDPFGTYVGGGSALFWSNMMGDQQLITALQINGSLRDILAEVGYVNRRHRFDWGVTAANIPYVTAFFQEGIDTVTINGQTGQALIQRETLYRQTSREITGLLNYPFSRVSRAEFQLGIQNIGFGIETRDFAYDQFGNFIGERKQNTSAGPSLTLGTLTTALVYDNSLFGGTGPVTGRRWRLEASPTFGNLNFVGALADIRQYAMPIRPLTLAARIMHFGRYGADAENSRLFPLYIGYAQLVRGHDVNSFANGECGNTGDTTCPVFDKLVGSKMLVGNLEARLPVLGPLGLLARSVPLPTDLFVFADAGVAWTNAEKPTIFGGTRSLATAVGSGLRINVFGALIAELALVRPLDRPQKGWYFQFSLTQGGF